jgi:alpha/beta superfamily hydrolase
VTGARDEHAPPAKLEQALAGLPRSALEVIPEADHFFQSGLAHISRAISAWLEASAAGSRARSEP